MGRPDSTDPEIVSSYVLGKFREPRGDVQALSAKLDYDPSVIDHARTLHGEPAGVKTQGGILEQILREVEVECLPGDIPSAIEADVSELVFGKVLRVVDDE